MILAVANADTGFYQMMKTDIEQKSLIYSASHLRSGRDNHLSKDFLIFVSESLYALNAKLIFYNLGARDHRREAREY